MIFVTAGLQLPFDRLFLMVDELISEHIIKEEVVVQGISSLQFRNFQIRTSLTEEEFFQTISKATLVISHAGIGSIINCSLLGTPIVVIPREASLNEHRNNHQVDISDFLTEKGITVCRDKRQLMDYLSRNRNGESQKVGNQEEIVPRLRDELNKLLG